MTRTQPSDMNRALIASWILAPCAAFAQAKPTVRPTDYGKWESLAAGALSPNGQWLVYGVNRVNEENELRIGTTARDSTVVIAYGSAPTFTGDSRWLAYSIGVSPAERDKLTKDKKPIRNALGIRNLATGATETVKDVSQFRFSGDGQFIALRRYPAEGKRAADLIVQDLARGTKMTFRNVSEFAWSEGRALLRSRGTDRGRGMRCTLQRATATGACSILARRLFMLPWAKKPKIRRLQSVPKRIQDTTLVLHLPGRDTGQHQRPIPQRTVLWPRASQI